MVFEKRMLISSTFYSNVTLSFRKALSNIEKKGIDYEDVVLSVRNQKKIKMLIHNLIMSVETAMSDMQAFFS